MKNHSLFDRFSTPVLGLIVLVISLLVRFGWFFLPAGASGYEQIYLARNIIEGHGFSMSQSPPYYLVTLRPPLGAYFMALVFKIFGSHNMIPLFVAQTLVNSINPLLAFILGTILFNRRIGFLGGLVYALHPFPGAYSKTHDSDFLCVFFILAAMVFLSRRLFSSSENPKKTDWVLSGFSFGCAALVRAEYLLLPILLLPFLLILRSRAQAVRAFAVVLFCFILTIAPWTLRNYLVKGEFILISDGMAGQNLFIASEPSYDQRLFPARQSEEFYKKFPLVREYELTYFNPETYAAGDDELRKMNRQLTQMAFENIQRHPWQFIVSRMKQLPYLWIDSGDYLLRAIRSDIPSYSWERLLPNAMKDRETFLIFLIRAGGLFFFYLIPYSLAFLGFLLYRTEWEKILILLAVPFFITLIHIPLWIEHSYSLPGLPFLFILTGAGIEGLLQMRRSRSAEAVNGPVKTSGIFSHNHEVET